MKNHARLAQKRQEEDIELEVEGKPVSEAKEVATSLNTYFKQKVVNLRSGLDVSVKRSLEYTDEYLGNKDIEEFISNALSPADIIEVFKVFDNVDTFTMSGNLIFILQKNLF